MWAVALLAEGVDRNRTAFWLHILQHVALLAEGVDRNILGRLSPCTADTSPSSRRAWIEICCSPYLNQPLMVALLAEGVDRNYTELDATADAPVALLAEGVDRNTLGLPVPLL